MNVIDSSAWLEFFSGGPNAKIFLKPIQKSDELIVPSITIYEVYKVILRESDRENALEVYNAMQKGQVIELCAGLSLLAADISLQYKLPMADSIILSTAHQYNAALWTQDSDFKDLPGVKYFEKRYQPVVSSPKSSANS